MRISYLMLRLVGEKCGVDRECCKCPSYYLKNLSLEREALNFGRERSFC
jgi:hypothetical protein